MILLDTNVVSEPLRPQPDPTAIAWLNGQDPANLYLPAIAAAELYYGWAILPEGRRKLAGAELIDRVIAQFDGRIVPFDIEAARAFGTIMSKARADGAPMPVVDGQIAAISISLGATLATRNVRHFEPADVPLINPWTGPA